MCITPTAPQLAQQVLHRFMPVSLVTARRLMAIRTALRASESSSHDTLHSSLGFGAWSALNSPLMNF
jgi:hypothetical protein